MPVARLDIPMQGLRLHDHGELVGDRGVHNPQPPRVEANRWNAAVSPTWLKVTCNPQAQAPRQHRRSDRRYPNSNPTRHPLRHWCASVSVKCAAGRSSSRHPFRRGVRVAKGGVGRVRFTVSGYSGDMDMGSPIKSGHRVYSSGQGQEGTHHCAGACPFLSLLTPRVRATGRERERFSTARGGPDNAAWETDIQKTADERNHRQQRESTVSQGRRCVKDIKGPEQGCSGLACCHILYAFPGRKFVLMWGPTHPKSPGSTHYQTTLPSTHHLPWYCGHLRILS